MNVQCSPYIQCTSIHLCATLIHMLFIFLSFFLSSLSIEIILKKRVTVYAIRSNYTVMLFMRFFFLDFSLQFVHVELLLICYVKKKNTDTHTTSQLTRPESCFIDGNNFMSFHEISSTSILPSVFLFFSFFF